MLGDDLARTQVEHLDCRMGRHTIREDQIVLSSDWQKADDDVAGCRCGSELIGGKKLCDSGHHHLYYNPFVTELAYWCVRRTMTVHQYRALQARRTRQEDINPYVMYGCSYKLEGNAACARGMHFLHITPEGRECRNPSCSFKEADACPHSSGSSTPVLDVDGREVARCGRCQMAFFDEGICTVFGHLPDSKVDDPCTRIRCASHRSGTTLYEALAAAHRAGKPLQAICREGGQTLAEASGWSEKLRPLGVRKPTATNRESNGVRTYIGRPIYAITVRLYEGGHPTFPRYLAKRADYATLSSEQKEKLAGRWYPLDK